MIDKEKIFLNSEKPDYYFEGKRENMIKYLPSNAKSILDVGCAAGNFLSNFSGMDLYRVGIEPDLNSYRQAKEKMEECFNGVFDKELIEKIIANCAINKFDVIFFNDVLEHLEKPWEALVLSKRILSGNGYIVASIPNILFYSNLANIIRTQDFKYESSGIMDITHLRFFSKKSIVRLFESS